MKRLIKIEGMSCLQCAGHVKGALEEIGGTAVEVRLSEGEAEAELDCEDSVIISAIEDAGYDVTSIKVTSNNPNVFKAV